MEGKYNINEKASSSYIMNVFSSERINDNDVKFYMNVSYQMATTLVIKSSNEKLDDASYSAALMSCINAASLMENQLTLNQKELDERDRFRDDIKKLKNKFNEIYVDGSNITQGERSKTLVMCITLLQRIAKKFGEFSMDFARPAKADL